jgi:hypothetical protein
MYRLSRTTFPRGQQVEVPHYRIETFKGQNLELIQEFQCMRVDFALLDANAINRATEVRPEGWELRGLIAVDALTFEHALEHAMTDRTSRRCGAVLGDDWYLLVAIEGRVPPEAGQVEIVGLYR